MVIVNGGLRETRLLPTFRFHHWKMELVVFLVAGLIATLVAAGTSAAPPTTFPRVLAASSTSPTKPDKCAEPPKCLQCNATLIQSKIERCTKIQPVRERYPPWPADHLNAQPHPSAHRPITATHLNFFLLAFCRSCPLLFFSFMSCLNRTFYK